MSNGKLYYENILANQNETAKNNVAWVADFTTLELFWDQKIYVFLCIDIHSNLVVGDIISKKVITASTVVNILKKAINNRCNRTYYNFWRRFETIALISYNFRRRTNGRK